MAKEEKPIQFHVKSTVVIYTQKEGAYSSTVVSEVTREAVVSNLGAVSTAIDEVSDAAVRGTKASL